MRKLSLADWFGYELPMEERYRLTKQAGFDGTLIWWGYAGDRDLEKQKYPDLAREQGLFVENIHASFDGANNLWLDNLAGQEYADMLNGCIDDCIRHGIPTVIVHLSNGSTPPPASEAGIDRIRRIADKAEKHCINIALENLRRPEYLRHVFDSIDSGALKYCFDSGHQNCWAPDQDFLSLYGARLVSLHLHDNDGLEQAYGTGDQHRLPFDGTVDWQKTMNKLKEINYQGPIALEITNFGYDDLADKPLEFLRIAYERAIKLQELLQNK